MPTLAIVSALLLFTGLAGCSFSPLDGEGSSPVAAVSISPTEARLPIGTTLQFSVTVTDLAGNVVTDRPVSWSSSDETVATVDADGVATGISEGGATIIATAEEVTGTASITVTSEAPPGRRVVIFEDDFEEGNLDRWDEVDASHYSVTSDPARVRSGDHSLQGTLRPEDDWGGSGLNKWYMPGYSEVFLRFDVMFEEGFENLRGDGNGMHFLGQMGNHVDDRWSASGKAGVRPDGTDFFATVLDPEQVPGDPTLRPLGFYSYYPDMSCEFGCWGDFFRQPSPQVNLTPGQWQQVVFHVKLNTPGATNGAQTLWIDGVRVLEVENIRWRDIDELRLNQISIMMYMPGAPKTQHIWIDNLVAWRPE